MTQATRSHHLFPDEGDELALAIRRDPPQLVPLAGRTLTVGRAPSNDLVLDDRTVSSRHCIIAEERGEYLVRDLDSRNGTHLNGVRVDSSRLWSGARLNIGRLALFCVPQPERSSAWTGPEGLVGQSPPMLRLKADLACYAVRSAPVLLEGESGTGKELAARAIHRLSPRSSGRFAAINCGALTPELAMSELFGHERGSFTGAGAVHLGAFQQADGGTLFLDEVGELDPRVQAALLRVLETGQLRRVGAEKEQPVDVRVVAATNRDLHTAAQAGAFRVDLYHRLAVLRLPLPPLRERLEDLPELCQALLERAGADLDLAPEALEVLLRHRWPGNVRELRNVLERAVALSAGDRLTCEGLRFDGGAKISLDTEDRSLLALLDQHHGNVAALARTLGRKRTTLRDQLNRLRQHQ